MTTNEARDLDAAADKLEHIVYPFRSLTVEEVDTVFAAAKALRGEGTARERIAVLVEEMRQAAHEWNGRDPINRRVARQLEYFVDKFKTALRPNSAGGGTHDE